MCLLLEKLLKSLSRPIHTHTCTCAVIHHEHEYHYTPASFIYAYDL